MKITFYGGAQNVTGSKHLVETDSGFRVLLDCGFYQGHRQEAMALNKTLPFDVSSLGAVIISHAHLDHCGLAPLLAKHGYRGPIFATPATCDVMKYMLEDAADILEGDADYLNRHLKNGQPLIEPLYTLADCGRVLPLLQEAPYAREGKEWTQLADGVRFKMYDAGHILGSAVVVLEVTEAGKAKYLAFSGDLGNRGAPILRDPETVAEELDALLLETTYGDRNHEPLAARVKVIRDAIAYAIKHKSKIIVPAFALGRTQELIYILHKLFDSEGFPKIPIFLDSPLAIHVTDVFKKHGYLFDAETWQDFDQREESPFVFKSLVFTPTREESRRLNDIKGPLMIIAASGMMEGGRILHHLKNNIEDPETTILITGYQAAATLGRRIQEGISPVRIFNRQYPVRARVFDVPSLSAHADQAGLLSYLENIKGNPKLFLVHGEEAAREKFAELAALEHPEMEVVRPMRGEEFKL